MSDIGNKDVFAKNLSFYIRYFEKNQKEVALAIGVTPASLNEWVKGKKYPRIDKIELLARYFGILKSDLIEDKGENKTLPSSELDISDDERAIVELFRQIPREKQPVVLEMIRLALKTQE